MKISFIIVLLFTIMFASLPPVKTEAAVPPPAGLVLWHAYEGDASDYTGVNSGLVGTGVAFAPGVVGLAADFPGTGVQGGTAGLIIVPDNASLQLTDAITIAAWVYPRTPQNRYGGNYQVIVAKGIATPVFPYEMFLRNDGLRFYSDIGIGEVGLGPNTVSKDRWSHVAVTYDRLDAVRFYVNGVQMESFPANGVPMPATPGTRLVVGNQDGGYDIPFNGKIDELKIVNRALSAAEVLALYDDIAAPTVYTIQANAGSGGSISPSGAVTVNHGANQSFTITPNAGYHIADVLMDGASVGAVGSYTFNNVTTNHTIAASFKVTYDSLSNLVNQCVSNKGIINSLIAKLDAARAADARGNLNAKSGAIGAFINEVQAQTGKSISEECAARLITLAKAL